MSHSAKPLVLLVEGQDHFTHDDAYFLNGQMIQYVDELIRRVIRVYNANG